MIARYAFHDQWAIDGGFSFIGAAARPFRRTSAGRLFHPVDLEFQP